MCDFSHCLQGPNAVSEVNLTCDALQVANTDRYFAVTAHWIEETALTKWELKNALIGFTRIANAHSGERLGQVLFKIVECVNIQHKVCVLQPLSIPVLIFVYSWATSPATTP